MHESIIAEEIIEEAKKKGNVKSIAVEVGDLAELPAKELEHVLKEMVDWEISVIEKKAKIKCHKCRYEGEPKIIEKSHDLNVFNCPNCSGFDIIVLEGADIALKEVKLV
jgi:Zn finger protein HypA/HybF involved in hydrogenase expression